MVISRWSSVSLALALATAAAAGQGLPSVAPAPAQNPVTPAKANLGKALFWDEQLSFNRSVACGTCHMPEGGGSDPRTAFDKDSVHPGHDDVFGTDDDVLGSRGVHRLLADGSYGPSPFSHRIVRQVTPRRSQSVINTGFSSSYFWNGRAEGPFFDPISGALVIPWGGALEKQALAPPRCDVEMGQFAGNWGTIVPRIASSVPLRLATDVPPALAAWIGSRTYPQLFEEAFGTPDVSASRTAMAIASYERTLVSNQAPYDAFLNFGSSSVLTPIENTGRELFHGAAGCSACHTGARLTDDAFHYTGVRPPGEDIGRFLTTQQPADLGAMKTPSLRNVELRAPYFHNGRMATLRDVIEFYDRGGDFDAPNKSPLITPLGLSQQDKDALLAFLGRPLTDPRLLTRSAPFDRPTLHSETHADANVFGTATAGSGGFTPEIIAVEPAALGLPTWTVALDGGNPGRPAILVVSTQSLANGVPFQGSMRHVGLGQGAQLVRAGLINGTADGEGWTSAQIVLPSDPKLFGTEFFAQWFVIDPHGQGQRFASTAAVALTLF